MFLESGDGLGSGFVALLSHAMESKEGFIFFVVALEILVEFSDEVVISPKGEGSGICSLALLPEEIGPPRASLSFIEQLKDKGNLLVVLGVLVCIEEEVEVDRIAEGRV